MIRLVNTKAIITMLKNYFKTAWRNLMQRKVYSALNIVGLATGMAVALLIGLWAYFQFSYDRFLPDYQQVYQAEFRLTRDGEVTTQQAMTLVLADILKKDIPEIKYVAHSDWMGSHGLVVGDKKLYLKGGMVGGDFLKIFQYPLIRGSNEEVLHDPYSIVLTQSTARSLFGDEDPINKMVRIDNAHDLKVTGVLKDVPGNSTLQFTYLVPFSYKVQNTAWVKQASTTWENNSFQTFVALQPGVTYAQVEPKLKKIIKQYKPDWDKEIHAEVFMHPLKDWHLYDDFKNGYVSGGYIDYVRMFSIIGVLVLLIACINFINLSTARSEKRAKEVGIRKTVGSQRRDLVFQFLIESLVITLLAFLLSLLFVQLALPAFNTLTGSTISIPYSSVVFWLVMLSYVLITGLLAGSRPAFYFSSFQPVKVLKGGASAGRSATLPRKILVVFQFSCSIALIISTIIVYQQIQYVKDRPSGYDANRLMMTDVSADLGRNYTVLRDDLLRSGMVTRVTNASSAATGINSWNGVDTWQGMLPNETLTMATIWVGDDYFRTLGMQLKEGRDFSGDLGTDSLSVIVNEAAVKRLRFKDALNQEITWHDKQQRIRVIGVVKDALMLSPFNPATPTFFIYQPSAALSIMYKLSPAVKTQDAIEKISVIFNKYNPAYPYLYEFADESYAEKFKLETLISKLAGIFAGLAIFISCIGLFALAAYTAEQRTKEIGVRKVLGASVAQLWLMLSKDFIGLVLISCVIASPVAYYFLHDWLQHYNYRIHIGPGVFIVSAMVAIAISIMTISFRAVRAALMNPVSSLRSE
jgi:putative ABC transport system permease protein